MVQKACQVDVKELESGHVCLSKPDGRECVWRRRGERYAECCVRQYNHWGGASVMVWAGISFNHKSPLVVINGNITVRRHIDDVLDPVMVPFLNTNPDHSIPARQESICNKKTLKFCRGLPILRIFLQKSTCGISWVVAWQTGTLNPETGNSWWLHCRKSGPIYRRIASDVSFAQCAGAVRHVFKQTVAISHTDSCATSIFGTTVM